MAKRSLASLGADDLRGKRVLAEAGAQASKIIEEARAAAAKIGEAETQRAIATAADIIAKAKQANEAELARMRSELRKEVGRLVVAASVQVTGKILTAEDRQRLAQETQQQFAA
jgi:F0F1-type ATP synthase membrane subunit b/b'